MEWGNSDKCQNAHTYGKLGVLLLEDDPRWQLDLRVHWLKGNVNMASVMGLNAFRSHVEEIDVSL